MPLTVSKRKNNDYLYFKMSGKRRLYLGTPDKPKEEKIKEAISHLKEKIGKHETEMQRLENLLPKEEQKLNISYKLVIFDLDGVIYDKPWHDNGSEKVAISTWDIVFQELGFYNIHENLKQQYVEDNLTYMKWTEKACNALKVLNLRLTTFENIINQRPYVQGVKEVFQTLHKNNVITAIITGSFYSLAQRAKKEIGGINQIYAHCDLHFNKNGFLKSWTLKPTDYKHKANFVKEIAQKYNIPKEQRAYIGDDVNDIDAFKEVGLSIAFNTQKQLVRKAAKVVIDSRNLKSILSHLYENTL